MVLAAVLVVFGPSIAMITTLDLLFWRNVRGIRDKIGKWPRRGMKFALSFGSNLWVLFSLNNAHRWGVRTENLGLIKDNFAFLQQQIPVVAALPGEVFLFVVMLFLVYLVLI